MINRCKDEQYLKLPEMVRFVQVENEKIKRLPEMVRFVQVENEKIKRIIIIVITRYPHRSLDSLIYFGQNYNVNTQTTIICKSHFYLLSIPNLCIYLHASLLAN